MERCKFSREFKIESRESAVGRVHSSGLPVQIRRKAAIKQSSVTPKPAKTGQARIRS